MPVQPWRHYNLAKKKIGNGTLSLAATTYKIALFKGTSAGSTWATLTKGLYGSITGEVTNGNGYATGGISLSSEIWTVGGSAGQYKFDVADPTWTATGGAIANVAGAVIYLAAGDLLVRASLATTPFTIEQGNTMTVEMDSAGVFTMS